MLEHHANQASGLLGLGSQNGPRMLAVVNHGDEQAELPLLWQLCLALVSYGYPVTVLDATTYESESNPGLMELLDNSHWQESANRDAPAWMVLPAAKGIQSLCTLHSPREQSLKQLSHLFTDGGVVILYCKVEWMTPLIAETGIEPLLAISKSRTSLITSYLALKRLLITAKLRPTIVNMIQDPQPASPEFDNRTGASLCDCAKRFLGQEVKALNIVEQLGEESPNADIQCLALRLMESALPMSNLEAPYAWHARVSHFGPVDHFSGSH